MSLKHTRAIIDAIHSGELDSTEYTQMPVFGLDVPKTVSGVPDEVLQPWTVRTDHLHHCMHYVLQPISGCIKKLMNFFRCVRITFSEFGR